MSSGLGSTGRTRNLGSSGDETQPGVPDDDEVYQYPRAGLGPVFASIESLLRCPICGGISDPPVSLPCCQQTFCSLCIRHYLDCTTPRCPCCRTEAASNRLLMCKELRSICIIWKRNRRAILAAADASSEAAAAATSAGGADGATAAAATAENDGGSSGRRRSCALGPGQGRHGGGGGKMEVVYYSQVTEAKLKKKLEAVGLPIGGGKAAMIARHKRLALLDAASSDREVPVPRRELLRQVASWEKEKDKAARSVAGGGMLSARAPAAGGRPGHVGGGAGDTTSPSEREQIAIPQKMKAGFSALIANARKNAKKRPSTSSSTSSSTSMHSGSEGESERKKARLSPESGGGGGSGTVVGNGAVDDRAVRHDGGAVVGIGASGGDGGATQILGVAGRMVRTRGPWRCVFSIGGHDGGTVSFSPAGAASIAEAGAARPAKEEGAEKPGEEPGEEPRAGEKVSAGHGGGRQPSTTSSTTITSTGSSSSSEDADDATPGNGLGERRGGAEAAAAVAINEEAGGGEGGREGGASGGSGPERVPPELLRKGGLVYLNTATGETVRDPPEELVARADEAESAGEYLVFVPSCSFIAAAAASAVAAPACSPPCRNKAAEEAAAAADAASRLSEAASAVGAAAESVLQAVVGDPRCSTMQEAPRTLQADGGAAAAAATCERRSGEEGQRDPHVSPLDAPTPPTVAKSVVASSGETGSGTVVVSGGGGGGGGGRGAGAGVGGTETWDRLSSLPMIDLSQGPASAPVDVEEEAEAGGGNGAGLGLAVEGAAVAAVGMWACTVCTLLNKSRLTRCAVCGHSRPKPYGSQQQPPVSLPSRGESSGDRGSNHRRMASKLRLPRRGGESAPQSTITSFTSRPAPGGGGGGGGRDVHGKGKDAGGHRMGSSVGAQASSPSPGAAAAAAASPPPPAPAAPPSLTAAAAPANGFPTVRSHERAPSAALAAAAAGQAEKAQQ